jgi:hypothetical protein
MAITWNDPIKTYFSPSDISHMLQIQPQLDLSNYGSVRDNAVLVYQWVSTGRMPPSAPWTVKHPDWVANFKAWIEAGTPES